MWKWYLSYWFECFMVVIIHSQIVAVGIFLLLFKCYTVWQHKIVFLSLSIFYVSYFKLLSKLFVWDLWECRLPLIMIYTMIYFSKFPVILLNASLLQYISSSKTVLLLSISNIGLVKWLNLKDTWWTCLRAVFIFVACW